MMEVGGLEPVGPRFLGRCEGQASDGALDIEPDSRQELSTQGTRELEGSS